MRQITIDKFKKNISNECKDLPLEIIKRGKLIAIVLSPKIKPQSYDSKTSYSNPKLESHDSKIDSSKLDDKGKFITYFK